MEAVRELKKNHMEVLKKFMEEEDEEYMERVVDIWILNEHGIKVKVDSRIKSGAAYRNGEVRVGSTSREYEGNEPQRRDKMKTNEKRCEWSNNLAQRETYTRHLCQLSKWS